MVHMIFAEMNLFSCGRVNRSKAKQLNSNRKQIILTKLICNQPSSVCVYTVKLPVKTDEGSKDTHFYRFIIPMKLRGKNSNSVKQFVCTNAVYCFGIKS